jgi:CHAT domain-containing protein
MGKARVLTGEEATEDALGVAAGGVRFLHFATHGVFYGDACSEPRTVRGRLSSELAEPLSGLAPLSLAGLALAGANSTPDELGRVRGILTAEELSGFDLSSCELAVLSACETNVGERRTGQGIQSLQSALHASGVRTAVTSLWNVRDDETFRVLSEFYRRVWIEREPKARALWSAKRVAYEQRVPLRHWAGWVLSGDPE